MYEHDLLRARFAALAPRPLPADWGDVLDRAGAVRLRRRRVAASRRRWSRRRKLVVALAIAIVVAALAAAAYATMRALFLGSDSLRLPPSGATPREQSAELFAVGASRAGKQRITITAKGAGNSASFGHFVLTPLQAGALERDTGTETSFVASERSITRDGQQVNVVNWVTTCKGKRGTFVLRVQIAHSDAGNGYHAGTGTWKFVRGTGRYGRISGGGRVANVWVDGGAWSERREGFATIK
jgi:hypothetical protein